ncbi:MULTISPECIES: HNH endonuclease signature motif containing protein [unclassified Rathayibacter]|uniref:HNH endonuclease signature motif containing protein n=1 Tax=unclassified Rathayibacter TaxID=2609250 RepID=UPI0006FF3B89|nr:MULTISPECIES: HNH endonuclease signature motif containing protein [unclassified Rathayibacter]KQQ03653.1 hypothetical protein ASF42_09170 [Rathayibacter sp. Leaf294]KQS12109.1 hypothetical protein ASG06_09170 [Rathayibacter sp. Leaf185]
MAATEQARAALDEARRHGDRAGELARAAAPILLASAEQLYAGYRTAIASPESFAKGTSAGESKELAERSIRAEFAVAMGVSERVASNELEQARLLVDDLPRTRAALAGALLRWEAGRVICAAAATLPVESRAEFDEGAAALAVSLTPGQLRRAVAQLREELHEQPLSERHELARQERSVWVSAGIDGMATLCALLPAPVAVGALHRLDRMARTLRAAAEESGDARTLAQLRADALADLVCKGDIAGTTPLESDGPVSTFVPGIRAEIRVTLPATTAVGLDDHGGHLDGYGPIPADIARELVGVGATFTRVLTDPATGMIASVGRTLRVPPPQMRLALQLRDQTCRFPGCTRPAATSEADHSVEWRNGGDTALHNLVSLCTGHHHVRHGDRWNYTLLPDGTAEWTTPTGRRVTTRPPVLPGGPPPALSPGTASVLFADSPPPSAEPPPS